MKSNVLIIVAIVSIVLCIVLGAMLSQSNARIKKISAELEQSSKVSFIFDEAIRAEKGWSATNTSYGVKQYIGEEPFRLYPHKDAPFGNDVSGTPLVEIIRRVFSYPVSGWVLVVDERGYIGYVRRDDLIEVPEERYISVVDEEALNGFSIGDRIEKLIGTLGDDYNLYYTPGKMYTFDEIEVYARDTNQVTYLGTDSSVFQLASGYKAGDSAMEVLNHYDSRYGVYRYIASQESFTANYAYKIADTVALGFSIDTDKLNAASVISGIYLWYCTDDF